MRTPCSPRHPAVTFLLCFCYGNLCWENGTMTDEQLLQRIVLDPAVMAGKPVIKGTRLTVDYVLNLLAHGETIEGVLAEYDGLTRQDVQACLLFATKSPPPHTGAVV